MTVVYKEKESCRVCGTVSEHIQIGPTKSLGAPDLDSRPSPMMRSTLKFQIRRCPLCGYCAPDLADASNLVRDLIKADEYRNQLNHPAYSVLANSFLCHAIIQQALGAFPQAGWASIYAAWVCDDEQADAAAVQCRLRAIHLFQRSRLEGMAFAAELGAEEIVLADLYRRIGQFDRATVICHQGTAKQPGVQNLQLLNFQIHLARKHDRYCHRIDEASPKTAQRYNQARRYGPEPAMFSSQRAQVQSSLDE